VEINEELKIKEEAILFAKSHKKDVDSISEALSDKFTKEELYSILK